MNRHYIDCVMWQRLAGYVAVLSLEWSHPSGYNPSVGSGAPKILFLLACLRAILRLVPKTISAVSVLT